MIGVVLLLFSLLFSTSARSQPACYLSGYELGKSFFYHYSSDVSIEKAVEHSGQVAQHHRAEHYVTADASIQCVSIEEDGTYHFELRIHEATWRRPQTADTHDTEAAQREQDARFLESLQRPFYYSQRCDTMELLHVFHPVDESEVTVNIKKNLVHAFDNKLLTDADDGASYDMEHTDHMGAKTLTYTHEKEDDGAMVISMEHDADRQLNIKDNTRAKNTVSLSSRNNKRVTMRDGVVHGVSKTDEVHFPTKSQDTLDSGKRAGAHAGTFRWHSTGSGEVKLVDSSRYDRKRHEPNSFPAVARHFLTAVRKRHADDDMSQQLPHRKVAKAGDFAPLPVVDSDELAAAMLLNRADEYRNIVLWLRREPEEAIARLEPVVARLNDSDVRMTMMRALGDAGTLETERALVSVFQLKSLIGDNTDGIIAWTDDDRDAAIVLLSLLATPCSETLDALEEFATHEETPTALARQAMLVFGTAAAAHQEHADRTQDGKAATRALDARLTLLTRLAAMQGDEDNEHDAKVLELSLENAMRGMAPEAIERDMADERVVSLMQRKRFGIGAIQDFIAQAKCDGTSCQSKSYDAQRPATPRRAWNDTFGVSPFLAYFETLLDSQADRSPAGRGYYSAFVGGKVDVRAFEASYTVASAYGKAQFAYANNISQCANYTLELYFQYLNNAYYFRAGAENNCTQVESTCEPNRPPTYARYNFLNSRDPSMLLTLFSFAEQVELAFVDVKFNVLAEGSLGFHYDWRFMVAPTRGGVSLNGFVEPHAWAGLTASVGLWIMPDLLGIEVIAKLELLNASLPVIGGINANTLQGCTRVAFTTSALGGSLIIQATLIVGKFSHTVYRWNGIGFVANIIDTKCCVECAAPCFNAFCNYRLGVCECDLWHDGGGCDIDCPPDCAYTDADMARGIQCKLPEHPERGERHHCDCSKGNFGWNCKSECPPGNLEPFGPNKICSGHGECTGEGLCMCEDDYFGADCSLTCPFTDAASTERCGANGRCVFNGVEAHCECFANFVGPKCQARCPVSQDERQAPCSRRGDCTMIDNKPTCMCQLGFYGDTCENIDVDGSGTALRLYAPPMPVVFEDTVELDGMPPTGISHIGLWFFIDKLPTDGYATIVEWHHGRMRLTAAGQINYCASRDTSCLAVPTVLPVGEWLYASVVVRFASPGYETFVRLARLGEPTATAPRQWMGPAAVGQSPEAFIPVPEPGVRLGQKFAGRFDLLAISHKAAGAGLALEFDDTELAQLRDEIVPPTQPGLEFYCMFDLRRGAHLYDNVRLLRAKVSDVGGRFVDSEIKLSKAAVVSEIHVSFALKGSDSTTMRPRDYALDLDGKRYLSGRVSADFTESASMLCKLSLQINGVEVLGSLAPVTGKGAVHQELAADSLRTLRTGVNELIWKVTPAACVVTIEQSHISLSVPAVDAVADFSGSPYSFIELDRSYGFDGSWTMDVWVFRDAIIYTQNGHIMSLVDQNDIGPRARDSGSIRVYETGSSGRGVAVQYASSRVLGFAQFSTPVGIWFHYTVGIDFSGGLCRLQVLLDGKAQVGRDGTTASVDCGSAGTVINGGATQNKLRLGAGFAGKLNDFRLRRGAWTVPSDVTANMHQFKRYEESTLLVAYSFDVALDPVVFDTRAAGASNNVNRGTVREGTFRTLIYGIHHKWKNCPGTSYFSPEAVCSTRSVYEHGFCTHARESDDYECTCNPGYYNSDCSGECPGVANGAVCSGHGECFSFNDTFCVCDAGFKGEACQYECPGWSDPMNRPQRECWGHGECTVSDGGLSAMCVCDAESERYGPYCQFQYGEDPVASVIDKCRNCDDDHKECRDGVCVCEQGYYMFFAKCKKSAATQIALSSSVMMTMIAMTIATLRL